jgi:hypothetical protein
METMRSLSDRVKKLLIVVVGLFIPDRTRRKQARHFLRDLQIGDLLTAYRFRNVPVAPRTVLIIECNPCHGEILPGFINYFCQLNVKVDLLVNESVAAEQPFVRMKEDAYRLFTTKPTSFPCFLSAEALKRYEAVVVATTKIYNHLENDPAVIHKFPELLKHPKLICVEHDLADIVHLQEESLLQSKRLLTLGRFAKSVMVNPHYFGQVAITPKCTPTRFLIVGSLGLSRDSSGLFRTLLEVKKVTTCFELVVIGSGTLDIPDELVSHVTIKGRVPFNTLFEELERASFILALLNPENPEHDRYRKTSVTGTAQLSYGFRKPVLIQQAFASTYGFTRSNAIPYEHDLAGAIVSAIQMSQETYARMQGDLGRLADALEVESLSNLRQSVEGGLL